MDIALICDLAQTAIVAGFCWYILRLIKRIFPTEETAKKRRGKKRQDRKPYILDPP